MSTNHTPNYSLCQWEATDAVQRVDFNEDNAKIDAALGTLARQVRNKADASALSALAQSLNCQAVLTGYTGTGGVGAGAQTVLSFSRKPLFICVGGADCSGFCAAFGQTSAVNYTLSAPRRLQLTWSGSSVSWYDTKASQGGQANHQMNLEGEQYTVFALLSV